MIKTIPKTISHDLSSLYIEWQDSHKCGYSLLKLRRNCPCATCKGGHGADTTPITGKIDQIELVSWKKVGRYALRLNWSDGHNSGIYTFDYLREECNHAA